MDAKPITEFKVPKSAVRLTDEQMKDIAVKMTDEGCSPGASIQTKKPKWKMKPIHNEE